MSSSFFRSEGKEMVVVVAMVGVVEAEAVAAAVVDVVVWAVAAAIVVIKGDH